MHFKPKTSIVAASGGKPVSVGNRGKLEKSAGKSHSAADSIAKTEAGSSVSD